MLGNGGIDGVLGRRDVRTDRAPQPAPRVRRVLVEVRRRCRRGAAPRRARRHRVGAGHASRADAPRRRRRVRAHPQRDVDGRGDVVRAAGRRRRRSCVVDATSAAGGLRWSTRRRSTSTTSRRRSASSSDGGLWIAACSPAAVERIERIAASGRWCPPSLDLSIALENSRARSDVQHAGAGDAVPARPTAAMDATTAAGSSSPPHGRTSRPRSSTDGRRRRRTRRRSSLIRRCARRSSARSTSTASIAPTVSKVLRAQRHRRHRLLPQARPQPAAHRHVPGDRPDDVDALTQCIDWVVERRT